MRYLSSSKPSSEREILASVSIFSISSSAVSKYLGSFMIRCIYASISSSTPDFKIRFSSCSSIDGFAETIAKSLLLISMLNTNFNTLVS